MSFCEHCDGPRFDRSRVLRALRETRRRLRTGDKGCAADKALVAAIEAVRTLDIPHLESWDDGLDEGIIH